MSIIILEGEEMKKRCNLLWALLLALSLMALPGMAGADMTWWEGGDGNWSDLNWNPRVPIEGDQAIIGGDGNDSFIVLDIDTPETLSERILKEEHRIYPEAIKLFAEGRISVKGRRAFIKHN